MGDHSQSEYVLRLLRENWRREMAAARMYEMAAAQERDAHRREVLLRLAELERKHAGMWADRLVERGEHPEQWPVPEVQLQGPVSGQWLRQIEAMETGNAAWYESLRHVLTDPDVVQVMDRIDADEQTHGDLEALLEGPASAERRLRRLWKGEAHRQGTGDWLGDAIYGVNDGLGAIFGIISGVAGYTANTHTVLVSGFFGALASTLSMGAGAWLATKSENEVMQTTLAQERAEIEEDPEHEVEELSLLYQLKGFQAPDADRIARHISQNPEQFMKTMVQEEFGFHEASLGNPWKSALSGGVATFVGAFIPLIPFFFMSGWPAMVTAAIISILAHFAVGAAKSLVTVRSWWASGLEMTFVGVLVGVVSYGLGELAALVFGANLG